MNNLLNYVVLPEEITDTERAHVNRINRLALLVAYLHVPLFMLLGYWCNTGVLDALIYSALILAGPTVAYKAVKNPRHLSLVFGFASMCLGALLVHLGQGPVQIEMHFHFFVFLALLAVYGNPMAILVAAVTVALHHSLFWFFIPSSVFNYDAAFWVVAIHAAFVVLESIAACFIARSFFDNVIGLEKIVKKRTEELDARTGEMKRILDNARQGFLTVNLDGTLEKEKSAVVEQWLGPVEGKSILWDFIGAHDETVAPMLKLGWDSLVEDIMPVEITLDNLPKSFSLGSKVFGLEYRLIFELGKMTKVLLVISDITAEIEKDHFEREQKEIIQIFECMTRDRIGFLEYLDESKQLIAKITDPATKVSDSEMKRDVHTLKGNSGIFGVTSIFDLCHEIENRMAENQDAISEADCKALTQRWLTLMTQVERFVGDRKVTINVSEDDLKAALKAVEAGKPHDDIAKLLSAWRFEPMRIRLSRIAEQAKAIADRLQKGDITVQVEDNNMRLSQSTWSPFWTTFIHVVRNAVDHGLEEPSVRAQIGKSEARIALRTLAHNDYFIIEIEDNGRGISWDALKKKCQEMELPHKTQADLINAMFHDGVTTKTLASVYSGRGVGMGAVKEACEKLGGKIALHSEMGKGTRFTFAFPIKTLELGTPFEREAS